MREQIDLRNYETRALDRFLVPKPDAGYRVATRLDPLDALVYTAAVIEAVPLIEKSRIPSERHVACAYRLAPSPDGALFAGDNGWGDFYKQSLILSKSFPYVVLADIADFYSQISHHRVQNALEAAGVPASRTHSIERMLSAWSALQSRGLPVGPFASIALAEACLNDVDHHLIGSGWVHTRYVDDFRIFCPDEQSAFRALHDLTEYLYTAHRLSLTAAKTLILQTPRFRSQWLENPLFLERRANADRISSLITQIEVVTGYSLTEEQLAEDDKRQAAVGAIVDLFQVCLQAKPLKIGLARHVLRRATLLRTNQILTNVLSSLDALAPVLRDVMIYLGRVRTPRNSLQIARALREYLNDSHYAFLPFVQVWLLEVLTGVLAPEIRSDLPALHAQLDTTGLRGRAQVAMALREVNWVRRWKETWQSAGPWDRRGIIAAGSVLPAVERRNWCRAITRGRDPVDAAVARYFLA